MTQRRHVTAVVLDATGLSAASPWQGTHECIDADFDAVAVEVA